MNVKKKQKSPSMSGQGTPSESKDRNKKVIVKSEGKWYENIPPPQPDLEDPNSKVEEPLKPEELSALLSKAEKLLKADVEAYKSGCMRGSQRSDFLWMEKIMKTGTLPDKMAAYAIRIQDSPVHNLSALQQLIGMVKTQGKQQCLMTADTTRDLFLEDLLPPNRKLVAFDQRGTQLRIATNKQLLMWFFEDQLKGHYRNFVEALRRMSSDTIETVRGKGVSVIFQLLTSHPEQEHILLPLIVNKLGDPVKKVASKALFHLNKLLEAHPQMKIIVVSEVERLLFRNNIGKRAQYYGICFLNHIRVLGDESNVAIKLVKVYLAFFKACVKTGDIDSKLMSGLLNGVNKAFPVAKMNGFEFTESLDTLYKIVQLSQFNVGVQALALLFQVTDVDKNPKQADRYYRVLYQKLLSPEVATTSHAMQFLNVIFKAMKRDNVKARVIGFSKRLLQLCCHLPPNLACAILFLISEVSKTKRDLVQLGEMLESTKSQEKFGSEHEFSEDENPERKTSTLDMSNLIKSTNITFELEDDSKMIKATPGASALQEPAPDVIEIKEEKHVLRKYDPQARNPAYCGAESTLSFELASLIHHFHPSVALFSQSLLNREVIKYDGNPLRDFTVGRFLERFVYRNAKQKRVPQEYQPQGLRNLPVNSDTYLETAEDKIPIEEKFFYKYFKDKKLAKKTSSMKKEDASDVESVDDEEFDEFMDNYFESGCKIGRDEEVDFAAEVNKLSKKKRKLAEDEDEDESEDYDDEEAIDFDGDDDADELIDIDGSDAEGMKGDSDDDDFEEFGGKVFKEKLKMKAKSLKRRKNDSMFVPAEEFSEMLESNADVAFSGSNTLINKDNSNVKQLKWETERDRWVKGLKSTKKSKGRNNLQRGKRRKVTK